MDGLAAGDVADALWKRKTLVKTWSMRGTLHLLPAGDLPLYCAALTAFQMYPGRADSAWLAYHGLTQAQLDAIMETVPEVLDGRTLTRRELAEGLVDRIGEAVRGPLLSGWGSVLKPAARRGLLCFGPSQGQEVTFVRPDQWLGRFQPMQREAALVELVRRYLRTHGPATGQDFSRWAGLRRIPAQAWTELGPELVTVDVDGRPAVALASSLEELDGARLEHRVRMLGSFDVFLLAHQDRSQIVGGARKARVYRTAGWVSPVVVVDGRVEAIWSHRRQGRRLIVSVEAFGPIAAGVRSEIEGEVASLGRFLGGDLELEYAPV